MKINISFDAKMCENDSQNLIELANLVENDCDINVQLEKDLKAKGVKDGGLTIGLTILGLSISAIGTLISVLSYWKNKNPKYSLSITHNNCSFSISEMDSNQLEKLILDMKQSKIESDYIVTVSKEN